MWTKTQKKPSGEPLDSSNGLQGVYGPKGVGVWMSDDDNRIYESGALC